MSLNEYFTFEQPERSGFGIRRFIALYMTTLMVNTGVNAGALILLTTDMRHLAGRE